MGFVFRSHGVALIVGLAAGLLAAPDARAESTRRTVRKDDALARLREGNARYVKGRLKHPDSAPKRRTEIAGTQKPFAVILGCADSRVPPELVFDQGLGDLFVVRTAGQAIGDIELASIEYAVEHLGARFILVLGHERCGAVKATVETLHPPPLRIHSPTPGPEEPAARPEHAAEAEAGDDAPSPRKPAHGQGHGASGPGHGQGHGQAHGQAPGDDDAAEPESAPAAHRDHLHVLVELLTPAVQAVEGHVSPADLVDAAVVQNVRMLVARLVKESPLLKSFLVAGRLRIAGARYDLDTGEVKLVR